MIAKQTMYALSALGFLYASSSFAMTQRIGAQLDAPSAVSKWSAQPPLIELTEGDGRIGRVQYAKWECCIEKTLKKSPPGTEYWVPGNVKRPPLPGDARRVLPDAPQPGTSAKDTLNGTTTPIKGPPINPTDPSPVSR